MRKVFAYLLTLIISFTLTTSRAINENDMDNTAGESSNETSCISLNIGDYILLGKYDDAPILWRCVDIDENGLLMMSDKILCEKPFDVSGQNGSNSRRNNPAGFRGSNYWGDSNIRSWLNSSASAGEVVWLCGNPPFYVQEWQKGYDSEKGFLSDGNFTENERNALKTVTQKSLLDPMDVELATDGSSNAWKEFISPYYEAINIQDFTENQYDKICFEYVTDKVFLLDIKQLWNISQNRSILGDEYYVTTFTQAAINNGATEEKMGYCLRTPYGRERMRGPIQDAWYVRGNAILFTDTFLNPKYIGVASGDTDNNYGIRPAFYLDEDNAFILSGSGTADDPYIMDGKSRDVTVSCNGTEVSFAVQPVTENDRTLVPFGPLFKAMGARSEWNQDTRTVSASLNGILIHLTADNTTAYVNGEEAYTDVPARVINGEPFVPLRFAAESLGFGVQWDEYEQRVEIGK